MNLEEPTHRYVRLKHWEERVLVFDPKRLGFVWSSLRQEWITPEELEAEMPTRMMVAAE